MCRGLDNPTGIKSISDVSCVFWEEDLPTEEAFITVSTSIRTTKSTYIQEIFAINPEVEGHYQDHWFWKRFFEPNQTELSFTNKTILPGKKGKDIELNYTCHHSTYKDNRFLTEQFSAQLEALKQTNPYYYTIYANGLWAAKENNQAFYKNFNRGKHVGSYTYNPELPVHITIDFNVVPHMSSTVWQIEDKIAICIDEISTKTPKNNTKGLCDVIINKYSEHISGVFIYGDSTATHADTRSEYGVNDWTILMGELKELNPILRVPSKNPPVVTRGQFINSIFNDEKDIKIYIDEKCIGLINDLTFGKEAEDGTKLKEKTKVNGITYEKYFHYGDGLDYLICQIFSKDFLKTKRGGLQLSYTLGNSPINEKHSY
jgi:hypothetical protein